MQDIVNMLMCPECGGSLSESLKCEHCGHEYAYKNGVYDVVSEKLSANQTILWQITDEMIESKIPTAREKQEDEWTKDYYSRKNKETLDAEKKLNEYTDSLISNFSGLVCDLATGMGGMLQKLLDSNNKNFNIVCTDIDKRVLMMTRKVKQTDDKRVSYVATDGRYLSVKEQSFDYITSIAAFGNIPEGDKVAKELYRVLKPGGKIIIQGGYIEKGSKGFEVARSIGVERGVVEEYLISDLEKAGFTNIVSTVVAEAVWAENPYDLIPAAGDIQRYCVIQAERRGCNILIMAQRQMTKMKQELCK